MIRVLVVDDDYRVADLHAQMVSRVGGFAVVGIAHSAAEARSLVASASPDLVLLDMYLPDGLGTDLVAELGVDVLMVTADSDAASVRKALGAGVVNYLVKPFAASQLADRLNAYARYRSHLAGKASLDQVEIDRAARLLREGDLVEGAVPKGRSPQTARLVAEELKASNEPLTAADVATSLGLSRPTAQRYLADLAAAGRAEVTLRYGTTGRPEHRYTWRHA
ncbi:MAG: response regulator [Actinomycetota bacterium]|nr:response regulator [Actinomycetota bacterium]